MQALRQRSDRERRQEDAAGWQQSLTIEVPDVDTEAVLRQVDVELHAIPAIFREAVILRYLRGFSEQAAATAVGCPLGTMKRRASEGLGKLRARLSKRGVALGGVALASLLTSEASAAVPETLLPSILATVKTAAAGTATTAASTTTASMLAKGAMKAMFWNSVKTAAMVAASVGAIGVGGVASVQAVAEKVAPKPAMEVAVTGTETGSNAEIRIYGQAVTENDVPVPGVKILCFATGKNSSWVKAISDAKGEFSFLGNIGEQYFLREVKPPPDVGIMLLDIQGLATRTYGRKDAYEVIPDTGGIDGFVERNGYLRRYAYSSGAIKIGEDGRAKLILRFGKAPAWITGVVRDEEDRPVKGAVLQVAVSRSVFLQPVTDAAMVSTTILSVSQHQGVSGQGISGQDGRFEIGVIPSDYYIARVTPPVGSLLYSTQESKRSLFYGGRGVLGRTVEDSRGWRVRRGQRAEINLPLVLGGAIEVVARDPEGKRVQNISVSASLPSFPAFANWSATVRNANGSVICDGLKPGVWLLKVAPSNDSPLASASLPVMVERGKVTRQEICLPLGAVLRGRVMADDGTPVAGVSLCGTETDADGRYTIKGLPTGPFSIGFTATNELLFTLAEGQTNRENVVAGGEFTRDVVLHPQNPATLSGKILTPDGKPLAGVIVTTWEESNEKHATTDADGRYRFGGILPGKHYFMVRSPDGLPLDWRGMVDARDGQENQYDIKCSNVGSLLKLHLRDAEGRPAQDIAVNCIDHIAHKNGSGSTHGSATSDSNGVASVFLMPIESSKPKPGPNFIREVRIFTPDGDLLPDPDRIKLEPRDGQVVERVITMRPGGTVAGRVTDNRGNPVPDALVSVRSSQAPDLGGVMYAQQAITGMDGRYELRNLPAGKYVAEAMLSPDQDDERQLCSGEVLPFEVTGVGKVEQDLRMATGGVVEGWVFSSDGKKLAASVSIQKPEAEKEGGEYSANCDPDADQPYRIMRVPPGRYRINVMINEKMEGSGSFESYRPSSSRRSGRIDPPIFVDVRAGELLQRNITLSSDVAPKLLPSGPVITYDMAFAAWTGVRLATQQVHVAIGKSDVQLKGVYYFKAGAAATKPFFPFPLTFGGSNTGKLATLCDGQELTPVPYLQTTPQLMSLSKNDTDSKKLAFGESLRNGLNKIFDIHDAGWQAHELDFAANQERRIEVRATLSPIRLADSVKGGPCYMFRVPITQGRVWARPAGKLEVTVTLGDDVKTEDLLMVRPPEVKRDGRTLTLALDSEDPQEDLIVVIRGKLPDRDRGVLPGQQPP